MSWQFKEATLLRQLDNGTIISNRDEGLLYVKLVNMRSGEEKKGTVYYLNYVTNFDTQTARVFCQYMGYDVKKPTHGYRPSFKYVPSLVFSHIESECMSFVYRSL